MKTANFFYSFMLNKVKLVAWNATFKIIQIIFKKKRFSEYFGHIYIDQHIFRHICLTRLESFFE